MDHHDDSGITRYPSGFGRGWIPAGRDIGVPGEGMPGGEGAQGRFTLPNGIVCHGPDDPWPEDGGMEHAPRPFMGGAGGWGCPAGAASVDSPHPNPSPEGAGPCVTPIARHDGWTPIRKARFLDHLAGQGNVRAACAAVGLSPEAAYKLRRREALFAQGWDAALVLAREATEQVLADRALHGVSEPIFYRGEQVGARVRFDSRLLLAHLARLDAAALGEAGKLARRFDEIVALVAGERPGEALLPEDVEPALPPTRAAHARRAQQAAEIEASDPRRYQSVCYDPECDNPTCRKPDDDTGEDEAEWVDPVAAGLDARAEAEAQWDDWRARVRAAVAGLDDDELLPETGRGTAPHSGGVEGQVRDGATSLPQDNPPVPLHHPADGSPPRAGEEAEAPVEFKSLDPVNCVNFAPARGNFALPPGAATGVASRRTGDARGLRLLRG